MTRSTSKIISVGIFAVYSVPIFCIENTYLPYPPPNRISHSLLNPLKTNITSRYLLEFSLCFTEIAVCWHQKDQSVSVVQGNITVYSKNHTDQINTMCWQHEKFLVLSLAVGIPTTSLQKNCSFVVAVKLKQNTDLSRLTRCCFTDCKVKNIIIKDVYLLKTFHCSISDNKLNVASVNPRQTFA